MVYRQRRMHIQTCLRLTSLLQALENLKQPEPLASPVSSVHDAVPLGLVGTPLVDGDEEALYCFVPMETVRLYPALVTPHNLLWLCDDLAVIECDSPLFRFIVSLLNLVPPHSGCFGVCHKLQLSVSHIQQRN
ncbi:hypothetical protein J4Q44_G00348430 [Coregonus suidteri]|uniref:Uncharacterized protein n=1 Tax=Coregonus suidteri TaxID=861788 RepID=A0AAN8KN11_9TELE